MSLLLPLSSCRAPLLALSLAALSPCQEAVAPAGNQMLDLIVLKNRNELRGTIVRELPTYIEIRLGPDTVVGMARDQIVSIERQGGGPPAPQVKARAAGQPDYDRWFVVHGPDGRASGWMHETAVVESPAEPGGEALLKLAQDWWFEPDSERPAGVTEVSLIERYRIGADAGLESAFARERVHDAGSRRLRSERITRAWRGADGRLQLRTIGGRGGIDEQRDLALPAGTIGPQALAGELRRKPAGKVETVQRIVFEALTGELRSVECQIGGSRRVGDERDAPRRVRVVQTRGPDGVTEEWIQGDVCLRRSFGGGDLVALPRTESAARNEVTARVLVAAPALAVAAGGRFALRLPNSAWQFEAEPAESGPAAVEAVEPSRDSRALGSEAAASTVLGAASEPFLGASAVTARAVGFDANFRLQALSQVDRSLLPDSALAAVLRGLRLQFPDAEVLRLPTDSVRGLPAAAARLTWVAPRAAGGGAERRLLEVHVIAEPGHGYYATFAEAPTELWVELQADFEKFLRRLELRTEGFAPQRSGPLAEPGAGVTRPRVRDASGPRPARRAP